MEAKTLPASAVVSDFYDFLVPDADHLAVTIGDVSGKGVPAALYMARLISDLRFAGQRLVSPEAILGEVNLGLTTEKRRGMVVSAQYVLLDVERGGVRVASGGHVPFLWYHAGTGEAEVVDPEGGPPLGVLADAAYAEARLHLTHGDSLILLTDGVLACANGAGETFDFPRLVKTVEAAGRAEPLLLPPILRALEAFTADGQRHDDLTLVQMAWR